MTYLLFRLHFPPTSFLRFQPTIVRRFRPTSTKPIVDENYKYWNAQSGKNFDVFWLGYETVEDWEPPNYIKVSGVDFLFYSDEILAECVSFLKKECGVRYEDGGCTLLLVKYDGDVIDYSSCFSKDLLKINNEIKLRRYVSNVIDFSVEGKPYEQLQKVLPKDKQFPLGKSFYQIVSIILNIVEVIYIMIDHSKIISG